MKICYFGAFEENYSRNKINIDGLKKNRVSVIKCSTHKVKFRSESSISMAVYLITFPIMFLVRNFSLIMRGYQLYRNTSFDIIFVAYPGHLDLPAAYILKLLTRKPIVFDCVISIYDTFVLDRKAVKVRLIAKALYYFEKRLLKLCDLILIDTRAHRDYLISLFDLNPNKVKESYIGAENKLYKQTFDNSRSNFFTAIFYGQASPLHGTDYIIKAAKICQKKDPGIKFVLLGDGQTRAKDVKLSRALKIKNITFLPSMKEEDAVRIVQKADVMLGVFKGSHKSQVVIPNKVYQGIALAKPVLTEDSPAIKEHFTHMQNIYLCEPANEKSLASALMKLRENKKLRTTIASEGHKLYKSKFTPDKLGKQLFKDIKNLALS